MPNKRINRTRKRAGYAERDMEHSGRQVLVGSIVLIMITVILYVSSYVVLRVTNTLEVAKLGGLHSVYGVDILCISGPGKVNKPVSYFYFPLARLEIKYMIKEEYENFKDNG